MLQQILWKILWKELLCKVYELLFLTGKLFQNDHTPKNIDETMKMMKVV